MDILAALEIVWGWIRNARFAALLAGVLFVILVFALGRSLGFDTGELWEGALLVIILGVFIFFLSKLSADKMLVRVVSWGVALLFLYASWVIVMKYTQTSTQQRVPYGRQFIEVRTGSPAVMLTPANLAAGSADDDKQLAAQNKIWEWVRDGLEWEPPGPDGNAAPDSAAGAVVVQSKSAFDNWHYTINGVADLNNNLKIEDGVTFLKSMRDGRFVYRQMSCKPDITSDENGASFRLVDPAPGEEVLMILRVRTKDGSELNHDPSSYGINLRVNP